MFCIRARTKRSQILYAAKYLKTPLEVAQQELERRVVELHDRRNNQQALLVRLDKERGKVRDRAELLSEKYEDVKDRGAELSARVENVLSKLQVQCGD